MALADRQLVSYDARNLPADLTTVNALARVALVACRKGCRLQVVGASPELERLLAFAGLADALPISSDLG